MGQGKNHKIAAQRLEFNNSFTNNSNVNQEQWSVGAVVIVK